MVCPSSVRSRCRRLLNDSLTAREEGQLSARTPSTAFTASPRSVPTEQHAPSSYGSEESEGGEPHGREQGDEAWGAAGAAPCRLLGPASSCIAMH